MAYNHLILCRPLLFLPSILPSIRVFSNESALRIRWPKHWSFSFNIARFSEHPGLVSLSASRFGVWWRSSSWCADNCLLAVSLPGEKKDHLCHVVFFFSCSVVSYSLWPHAPQHTRLSCPSLSPRVCSNSCPLSRSCHQTIYLILCRPLLLLPSIFPSIRVLFNESSLFASGDQSIGASASASVFPTNIQDWSPLGWTGWISLQSKGLARLFSNTTVQKHQFCGTQLSLWSNSHIHTWLLEKP